MSNLILAVFFVRENCGELLMVTVVSLLFISCISDSNQSNSKSVSAKVHTSQKQINPSGSFVNTRFDPPLGFQRTVQPEKSFPFFLQNLKLKKHGTPVLLYDGQLKPNQSVHAAVIDLDVGKRDLQQCADAVMRLRAEYLFAEEKIDDIKFNFTNGFPVSFKKWAAGNSVAVNGNNCSWKSAPSNNESYASFRKYLDLIYTYAGTQSLEKELRSKNISEINIGDVFIIGGSPGHAVIVMDMAIAKETGEKAFLLAQSYMPAQSIHILNNPKYENQTWYFLKDCTNEIETPEWRFLPEHLHSFQ